MLFRSTRWLDKVWTHDDATYQHCLLVAGVAAKFSLHLGFATADRDHFVRAALLHDLGKAKIPLAILNKPGRLDESEMTVMRTHPAVGADLLAAQGGFDAATLAVVRSHHEMLDGTGYPEQLRGDSVSDPVRLLTVCDIYAALSEKRSYKEAKKPEECFRILYQMGSKLERSMIDALAITIMN